MKQNFHSFIEKVINDYEGTEFEEVPEDAGGPTKFGITIYDIAYREGISYNNVKKNWSKLRLLVKNLKKEEAIEIYKQKYWNIVSADELPTGIDCSIVDLYITSGTNGVRIAQKVCGITVDGKMGPKTLEALKKQDPKTFVLEFCEKRKEYYSAIVKNKPSQKKFLKGWYNRAEKCKNYCLSIISSSS